MTVQRLLNISPRHFEYGDRPFRTASNYQDNDGFYLTSKIPLTSQTAFDNLR